MIAQKSPAAPDYHVPRRLLLAIGWSLVTGGRRSVLADAQRAFADRRPQVEFRGTGNIPPEAACLVVCNHYARPGFSAWWIGMGVNAAFAGRRAAGADIDIRWVMSSAWTFPEDPLKATFLTPITRIVYTRLAKLYGFVSMPPMPPAPHEVKERAAAVLRAVRMARAGKDKGILVGLSPEGQDFGMYLGVPPEGVGEFISLLVAAGLPVLPVGVFEEGEELVISVGEAFVPDIRGDKRERDSQVAAEVMAAIQKLVPF